MGYRDKKGFILGVVLLLCLVMAAFIFSYNSIVRSRNLQAHHYMSSEIVGNLAVSGVKLLSAKIELSFAEVVEKDCPQLFNQPADKITQPIVLASFNDFCDEAQADFQKFLDNVDELKESGVIGSGYPVCEKMEVTIDNLRTLAPETGAAQFQRGRDPVEKCGMLNLTCVVKHFGISRKAQVSQQFRIVSMAPGPIGRFTLFVSKTPYPDSYNAMGVDFDGNVDHTYSHSAAGGQTFTGPLLILNGTDSENITSTVAFRDGDEDKKNLRERGWIYIGSSGPSDDAPVYLKIPNGFSDVTGGLFMFGWPSAGIPKLLAPAQVESGSDFKKSSDFPDHNFLLGTKYHGYYTCEEDNPQGVGAKNLWPGLTTGEFYKPSDRFLSASTWLYPYGSLKQSSRTLIIGPVLAGYLKYYFIKGTGLSGNEYRGLFSSLTPTAFTEKQDDGSTLLNYCYFWSGLLIPPITGDEFFLNDYTSFKKLMPWNSLPSKSATTLTKGVAFNMLFDFMKYDRSQYPDPELGPTLSQVGYQNQQYLVPLAMAMQSSPVKGVHPSGKFGIFFAENGEYNPNVYPDNCIFYGDLDDYSVANSSLVSNRITNIIDLSGCKNLEEECSKVEKTLFKKVNKSGKDFNQPRKSGIFLIRRRAGIDSAHEEALMISSLEIDLCLPMIVVLNNGSLNISKDIISPFKDGAPENLLTLAVCNGDVYITGTGIQRTVHAYITAVGAGAGRLLKPATLASGPDRFDIFGGLAVTELGLYQDKSVDPRSEVGSTMLHFPAGGKITYNTRFNPSLPAYADNYRLVMEPIAGTLSIQGGLE